LGICAYHSHEFGLLCGTKFLRVLIFAVFVDFFHDLQKKVLAKKITSKNFLRKNLLQSLNQTVSFVQKQNEIRTKTFRNKTMKLQLGRSS